VNKVKENKMGGACGMYGDEEFILGCGGEK
jgi:hypothetical protein